MCLCSKQSKLFSFYALFSGGKPKCTLVLCLVKPQRHVLRSLQQLQSDKSSQLCTQADIRLCHYKYMTQLVYCPIVTCPVLILLVMSVIPWSLFGNFFYLINQLYSSNQYLQVRQTLTLRSQILCKTVKGSPYQKGKTAA